MKLKSKHLVEILKNISDYHYGKSILYRLLSDSLDNNNIITLSAEHVSLINRLCSKESNIKKYLQKEGVFNKENVFSKDISTIGDLFSESNEDIQIGYAGCNHIKTGKRDDLRNRSLYVHDTIEIIIHECEYETGTIIEFVKKES